MAQQKLAQPMPRAQLILLRGFARAHQIAQGLMRRVRHPHRRQVARAITPRQLHRIPPIGLHPIARLSPAPASAPPPRTPRRAPSAANTARSPSGPPRNRPAAARPAPASSPASGSTPAGSGSSPSDRTSPVGSATATAIVSAWTSNPTNRTLLMTGSFRMWLCVVQFSNSQRNPRAANRSRSFHPDHSTRFQPRASASLEPVTTRSPADARPARRRLCAKRRIIISWSASESRREEGRRLQHPGESRTARRAALTDNLAASRASESQARAAS